MNCQRKFSSIMSKCTLPFCVFCFSYYFSSSSHCLCAHCCFHCYNLLHGFPIEKNSIKSIGVIVLASQCFIGNAIHEIALDKLHAIVKYESLTSIRYELTPLYLLMLMMELLILYSLCLKKKTLTT